MNIQFEKLIVGNTDARDEVNLSDPESVSNFKEIFVEPEGFPVVEFIKGSKYLISGLKGTGKTSLLKHIALSLPENANADFIYFKSDFKEDNREEIEKLCTFEITTDLGFDKHDYEKAWKWFILRRLVELNESFHIFEENENFSKFKTLVYSVTIEKGRSGLSYLFPRIKDGSVSINIAEIAKVNLNFEFLKKETKEVKFTELVDNCWLLFESVNTIRLFYLLIDELELSYLSDKTYLRDSELIRDFLIVIKEMNQFFRERTISIFLIAGVRSEVINAVGAIGKEVLKIVEDYSFPITWYRYEKGKLNHPLIKILVNKLRLSEIKEFGTCTISNEKLYYKYFSPQLFHRNSPLIILNNTWYRPRDIVRWLNVIKTMFSKKSIVDQSVFESVRKEYSILSLNEVFEGLNTIYNKEQLKLIRKILTDFSSIFEIQDFKNRIEYLQKLNPTIDWFLAEQKYVQLLEHFFDFGVIGNIYPKNENGKIIDTVRWVYRADYELLPDRKMMIHNALRPALSITEYK